MPTQAPFTGKICCIGAGYVGGPTMAMMAHKTPITVTVVDLNKQRIDAWNSDHLPIYEPGLKEVVDSVRGKRLFFTTDIEQAVREAEIIFVSVNTPTKEYGFGKGQAADLTYWEGAARSIAKACSADVGLLNGKTKIIVEKSTVPVYTADAMTCVLQACGPPGVSFQVLSNPEFLAEGTAISDLTTPDRVLIGGLQTPEGLEAIEALASVYRHWVPNERIITANVWSAEVAKLIANAFLAQRISSVNSLSALCEASGADIDHLAKAIGADPGLGPKFLKCGPGFGGSCFQKDILNLIYLCKQHKMNEAADYWEQILKMNDYQKMRFSSLIVSAMFNTVNNKKISIFGFAFKADTGDTRESPAIDICRTLLAEGAQVCVYDPEVKLDQMQRDLAGSANMEKLSAATDAYTCCQDAHAIVIITEWKEFATLDYEKICPMMRKPSFVFDGRNILNHQKLRDIGYNVLAIGKPIGFSWKQEH
mmetsp:Transcript_7852/g.18117  ORF Transcript_7852/g.18117 Transcript_7852/m.18117 type:complete len:478 (-) Transcript_7852:175-1608(-)